MPLSELEYDIIRIEWVVVCSRCEGWLSLSYKWNRIDLIQPKSQRKWSYLTISLTTSIPWSLRRSLVVIYLLPALGWASLNGLERLSQCFGRWAFMENAHNKHHFEIIANKIVRYNTPKIVAMKLLFFYPYLSLISILYFLINLNSSNTN